MNLQNLKREGELRKSIIAPPGHVLVVADSAQIEARTLAWLADDQELLQTFRLGQDAYKLLASKIYNVDPDVVTKDQRFVGKVATLGLGYGMGHAKFRHTLATGAMGPPMYLSEDTCQKVVGTYRSARYRIKFLWSDMERMLMYMLRKMPRQHKVLRSDDENRIWLPNGMFLSYPFLEADWDHINERYVDFRYYNLETGLKRKFVKSDKDDAKRIYGGLLTENVVQALARIIVADQMLAISNRLKKGGSVIDGEPIRRIVMMTHDEIVACVPEAEGQSTLDMMIEEMRRTPDWAPDLPLNAEGGFDVNYSK